LRKVNTFMYRMLNISFFFLIFVIPDQSVSAQSSAIKSSYLGFDRNLYPGDAAMVELRKTFSFTSYWLGPPPGEKENSWRGKRKFLRSQGFGFLALYRGRDSKELVTDLAATQKGFSDARAAIMAAKQEGFPSHTIIFLDVEEGGRLTPVYHAYLRAWGQELARTGFRPGVYCSAIPVKETSNTTITTADDIHADISNFAFWVYNDACPPSPGCNPRKNPPPPSRSGVSFAKVWQFAQSPRRKEFASGCPTNDQPGGNCYSPTDVAHKWFLDLDSASSPDPSSPIPSKNGIVSYR
jgi:hypothetical protein